MNIKYNETQTPSLLIGLGGLGSRIVDDLYGKVKKNSIVAFCVDTDVSAVHSLKLIDPQGIIDISTRMTLLSAINIIPDCASWFPVEESMLFSKTTPFGAGQARTVGRLIYELALLTRKFDLLIEIAEEMARNAGLNNRKMRINIVTSLFGGTGSGIFLQLAMLLRKHIINKYPKTNLEIQGNFILPAFTKSQISSAERSNMEALTYAALKELNAITTSFYNNSFSVRLVYDIEQSSKYVDYLPYDYCFLYKITSSFIGYFDVSNVTDHIYMNVHLVIWQIN